MSTLYIAATAFQLITILNIRVNMNGAKGELIIHEKSIPNSHYIKDRIVESGLFNDVFLFKDYDSRLNTIFTGKNSIASYCKLIYQKHCSKMDINDYLLGENRIELQNYNEAFCFNKKFLDILKAYDNIKINFIDEGVGSYTNGTINKASKIDKIYLYRPELAAYYEEYKDKFCTIPALNSKNTAFKNLLNTIWGYKDIIQFKNNSVIIFDQPLRFTPQYLTNIPEFIKNHILIQTQMYGKYINDEKIKNCFVKCIREIQVNNENVIVKMHPRSSVEMKNYYEDKGILVLENTSVPWEIVCMNLDVDKICLVSMFSTVTLSVGIYFANSDVNYKSMFLYNLAIKSENVKIPKEIVNFLESISARLSGVKIIKDIDELKELAH